ncbi:MAG: chorismate synthase [Nitrospirae bacterium]|nr:chorismate synthase [Nitrospirota bacterium]
MRFFTSGESHGKALTGIIEGVPAGFDLSPEDIDRDLKRRQGGHGRGGRMTIESDRAEIISGVRWGKTLGSPIAVSIENKDWKNWLAGMSVLAEDRGSIPPVTRPRPGHADLAGALKYDMKDMRNILERSSARETAMRVALGAIAKKVLADFGIVIGSYVMQIGNVRAHGEIPADDRALVRLFKEAERSSVRCPDEKTSRAMVRAIDRAVKGKTSLGGAFTVFAAGVPVGLGSHTQWDRKLDGRLAQAIMGIQAIKGISFGDGFAMASLPGHAVMDQIYYAASARSEGKAFYRRTNHAGGIEGGMSNGMPVLLSAVMKPIPTLRKPLMSVDVRTKKEFSAAYERSDTCAVPAAAVVAEAMTALVLADAFIEKFGGDSKKEMKRNFRGYLSYLKSF